MIRPHALLLGFLLLAPPLAAAPPAAPPSAPAATLTADQARAALDVLNDPKKRAAVVDTLRAIAQTQKAPEPAAAPPVGRLEPNSLGAQVLLEVTRFLNHASERLLAAAETVQSVPLLWSWLYVMATNPIGQGVLIDIGWRLLFAVPAGLAVAWAIRRSLRRTEGRLLASMLTLSLPPGDPEDRAEAGDIEPPLPARGWSRLRSALRRLVLALARFGLKLLPLLGLLAAGQLVSGLALGERRESSLVILAILGAYALSSALIQAADIVLAPQVPGLRLVRLEDAASRYLMHWVRRLIVIGVCGYAIAEVGLLLGLSNLAHDALLRTAGLLVTIGIAIVILRLRRVVRRMLLAPEGAAGWAASVRNRLAGLWHWTALLLLAAFWLIWAVDTGVSDAAAARYAALTVLLLVAARLVRMSLLSAIDRLTRIKGPTTERYQGLEDRLRWYNPVLNAAARGLVHLLAVFALLQLYGIGALTWLWSSTAGQHIMSGLLTLAVTILAAIAVWEMANAAIQRHLDGLMREAQLARSARLRTLLPLLRTMLFIAICTVTTLMVLSQIGVDIAPLLAGAGILGVAIGFGSQKLVQDLITGIFLLLENALQVGDIVSVSGLSGKVEGLSVRTIRLRAADGSVHIIPFSAVTSVTNFSRGVGNADVRVTVELDENTDRVAEVLTAIVAQMRAEPDFETRILLDFQLWGVDRIDAAGVTVVGQVPCTDTGRWPVQREINRRVKQRFDEIGIRFHKQVVLAGD